MKKLLLIPFLVLFAACTGSPKQVLWNIDNLNSLDGHQMEVLGDPKVVLTDAGHPAIEFDGDGDRLLVLNNPLLGAEEFTIEIVFRPNDVFPDNAEPRFFHIEGEDYPDRRITIELRLNDQKQWYFDAFIKSDISKFTLVDPARVHPVGEWAHAAITYKDGIFTSYVNGKKELSAEVQYQPISDQARTSIGARMNQVHWFNGLISEIRISHKALQPHQFMPLMH